MIFGSRTLQVALYTLQLLQENSMNTDNMSQAELDLYSDINNDNNDANMDDWSDAHNDNNENYIETED